jgi:peptidyl-tRNA hydrolase
MRKVDLSITFVYIVDESLGMSKGKIAAQVSHVAMELADEYKILGRAIVLKADHNTIMKLMKYPHVKFIVDAGLNEVPEGTLTCIGFFQDNLMRHLTKNLKLV